ncbi:MAG: hypothetical protein K0U84_14680 [Actinomycetia bacterium]|nr:hypothetical protein [Actinomycetes bacterium]
MQPLLRSQGACATRALSGWQLGWWELTDRALRFVGPNGKPIVDARLGRILGVEVGKRKFLLTTKRVLIISYASGESMNQHSCWLITADVEQWRVELSTTVPQRRFAADAPIEVHVDSDGVTVIIELHTGARSDPPVATVDPDRRHLVLTSATGAQRLVDLPAEVADVVSVNVSSTATMVVRLRRVGAKQGVLGDA